MEWINVFLLYLLPFALGMGAAALRRRIAGPKARRRLTAAAVLILLLPWLWFGVVIIRDWIQVTGQTGDVFYFRNVELRFGEKIEVALTCTGCALLGFAAWQFTAFLRGALRGKRARRALLLTLTGSLTAFFITAGALLYSVYNGGVGELFSYYDQEASSIFQQLSYAETMKEPMEAVRAWQPEADHTVMLMLLADRETGEILAQTTSVVSVSDHKNEYYLQLDLSPYLSKQDEQRIRSFQKRIRRSRYLEAEALSVAEDGGTAVPVEILFRADEGAPLRLVLSDLAPTRTFTADEDLTINANFFGLSDSAKTRRQRKLLAQAVLAELDRIVSEYDGGMSGGKNRKQLTIGGLKCTIYDRCFHDADDRYFDVFFAYGYEQLDYLLHTLTYREMMSILIPSFLLLTLLLVCTVLRYLQKERQLEQARTAFLSAAAHELKTPLAIIANNCECAMENVAPKKNAAYAAAAFRQSARMSEMLNQLLRQTALESADSTEKTPADLTALLRDTVKSHLDPAAEKELSLTVEAPEQATVRCNPAWTAAAVDNLLSNAVRYTEPGGRIRVDITRKKRKITLTVENMPAHIEEADLVHIWEPLYRGDRVRNSETNATGMGLSICKQIFDLHGWNYKAENTETGVRFTVTMK